MIWVAFIAAGVALFSIGFVFGAGFATAVAHRQTQDAYWYMMQADAPESESWDSWTRLTRGPAPYDWASDERGW